MPYNNVIARSEVQALIPEDVANDVIQGAITQSAVLRQFRSVRLASAQQRIPVLSVLPTAYWVTGDTGIKQTTEMNWTNKFLNIEEIAAIVPIPEAVLDDASFDVWGEIRPRLEESIGRAVDSAVFFGTNAPASFPTNVNAAAAAAGNNVTEGSTAATGGFHNDLDLAIAALEADGYDPTGYVFDRRARSKLRAARDTAGNRLDGLSPRLDEYLGDPITYAMPGLWPSGGAAGTNVRGFVGDWTQFIVGIRQDITYKVATEGVIQDNTGVIQYNLFQQDMVAMRVTFRVGWQVANGINYDQATEANRYPASVIRY